MRGPLEFLASKMPQAEAIGTPVQSNIDTMRANWKVVCLGCAAVSVIPAVGLLVDTAQYVELRNDLPPVTFEVNPTDLMSKIPAGAGTFLLIWASAEAYSWREDDGAPEPDAGDVAD